MCAFCLLQHLVRLFQRQAGSFAESESGVWTKAVMFAFRWQTAVGW
jgi:hypothetical protein